MNILLDRIDSLLRELGQAQAVLDRTPPDPVYGIFLQDRVRLEDGIKTRREELRELREKVTGNSARAPCWAEFAEISLACGPLFAECLAFAVGPLVRANRMDAGLCRVADALLEDLSVKMGIVWRRHTVLAEAEFIDQLAEIIRLRFPVTSVWDLPLAAHEFGHFVGLSLEGAGPLKQLIDESKGKDYRWEAWLREHFADTFATYTLGPAFACSCLLLRLNPAADPHQGYFTHPSDAMRAYAILRVLERMDEPKRLGQEFGGVIALLRERWQECSADAGRTGAQVDPANKQRIEQWLKILYALISKNYARAEYPGWSDAKVMAAKLTRGQEPADAGMKPGDADRIADVLNAAWICRLQADGDGPGAGELGARALTWCCFLADKVNPGS